MNAEAARRAHPTRALLISDGRPGHYHLSEGVLAAVLRLRELEVKRLEVRRRFITPNRLLATLFDQGMKPAHILQVGYGLAADELPSADLVVSAGGNTIAANIAASRLLGATNIFYGSLRHFRPSDVSLILTSHARFAKRPRHVMTLKPAAGDPDLLGHMHRLAKGATPRTIGLLVGGNTSTITYDTADWVALADLVRRIHEAFGTRWIVSNSRRTPRDGTTLLAELAAAPDSPILRFIDVESSGPGTLTELFALSDVVVCTVDSSSMVSEAVWMRRPMVAVSPRIAALPPDEAGYRRYLEDNGWARSAAIADLTPERLSLLLSEITPLSDNPLDMLAETLRRNLPQLSRNAA